MVRPFADLRAIRKKYKKGLVKGTLGAIYAAYTRFNERAYPYISQNTPPPIAPSKEYPAGFLGRQIKLVTRRAPGGYVYKEVDVPDKFKVGSAGWRAWLAIKALHYGWQRLPFKRPRVAIRGPGARTPKGFQAMGLPVIPGARVPRPGQSKIPVKGQIEQKAQITLRPWITRTWEAMEHEFPELLEDEVAKIRKVKEKLA